jgi:hypothetical protein
VTEEGSLDLARLSSREVETVARNGNGAILTAPEFGNSAPPVECHGIYQVVHSEPRRASRINSADPMDFGTHHFLSDSQRRVGYRFADEVLYAIGVYLLSLEPPRNPNPPPADLVARGQAIFRREKCETCHPAPDYTTGKRLRDDYERKGWSPPGVTRGAIPGLEFLTKLPAEDKTALIAFLRSL